MKFQALRIEGRTGNYPTAHGIVEFDTGPRTPRRRYIHIHTAKDTPRSSSLPWINSLLANGYDAILVKGAMKTFAGYDATLGGRFVDRLSERNGILVDGDSPLTHWPWQEERQLALDMRVHTTPTQIEGLGYGTVRIFNFGN